MSLKCRDIGMDCNFEAKAKTEAKLMKKASKHMAKVHNMKEIPPELMAKAKAAVKTIP